MKFKIGDRVVAPMPYCLSSGYGTIVSTEGFLESKNPSYVVEFSDGYFGYVPEQYLSLGVSASNILKEASDCLVNRAVERDKEDGERSMKSCVTAFNALTGHTLTESDGWLLMVCLKASRAEGGNFRLDDYVDGSAYFSLYGEAASKQNEY